MYTVVLFLTFLHDSCCEILVFNSARLFNFSVSKLLPFAHPFAANDIVVDWVVFLNHGFIVLEAVIVLYVVFASVFHIFGFVFVCRSKRAKKMKSLVLLTVKHWLMIHLFNSNSVACGFATIFVATWILAVVLGRIHSNLTNIVWLFFWLIILNLLAWFAMSLFRFALDSVVIILNFYYFLSTLFTSFNSCWSQLYCLILFFSVWHNLTRIAHGSF